MIESRIHPIRSPSASGTALLWLSIAVLAVAFVCTEHGLLVSQMDAFGTTEDDLELAASSGRLLNKVGFSLVALLGAILVVRRRGRPFRLDGPLAALVLLFFAWCLASVLWTIDTGLTTKRLAILAFCFLGALGVGRQLAARDLCVLTLVVLTTYVAIGLCAELALGTFRPLLSEYRFAGTMHPNGQGHHCACICLASALLLSSADRGRGPLIILLILGAVFLLLTKSRTSCCALLGALVALGLFKTSARAKLFAGLAAVWAICAVALAVCVFQLEDDLPGIMSLGRQENVGTLTGRTELWNELISYAQARPLAGYGYGSFWTPEHVSDVSSTVYWGTSSAHSVYLETVLRVGLVGAGLLVLVVAIGVCRAAVQYRKTGDAGDGFLFALLVYGVVSGVAESGFVAPSFLTLVAGCGLVQLAFFREGQTACPRHGIACTPHGHNGFPQLGRRIAGVRAPTQRRPQA